MFTALTAAAVLGTELSAANAEILISIDKSAQRMTVKVDGAVRHVWAVSTGRSGYATPSGSFRAFRLEKDHYSKEWDDAPMPHSIFFTPKGHAIHGSYETRRLGRPASHGCVRLAPANAARLFALVKAHGLGTTKVVVGGAPAPTGRPMGRVAPAVSALGLAGT
jgi:lipoprotein-anchoring transpeptidase ErfK/SrfK